MPDEKEKTKLEDWLLARVKKILLTWKESLFLVLKRIGKNWRDWLTPAVIMITGGLIGLIIDCSQRHCEGNCLKSAKTFCSTNF